MDTCYRQKRVVGELSSRVAETVAHSSPFLRKDKKRTFAKERRHLTEFCNGLQFPNPSGYAATMEAPTRDDWRRHISWMRKQGLGKNPWETVAIISEQALSCPIEWLQDVTYAGIMYHCCTRQRIDVVKGLEFPHVMVFLTEETYRSAMVGFEGSGQGAYTLNRLLRIPFSRARDSLTVWVSPEQGSLR